MFSVACIANAADESFGDPFEKGKLQNPNWKWKTADEEGVEPKAWDMGKTKAGWLHVTGELNRNLWPSDTTNRLYQEHEGDFDVETHLYMDYEDACVVAGIAAYSPTTKDRQGREGEWVTIKLWGRGPANGNNAVIQYQKRQFDAGEGLVGVVPGFQDPAGEMDIYMRLRREKDTFTAWWKRKAKDAWIDIVLDRRAAIHAAIAEANAGDTVLLSGKGHETTIAYADRTIAWDEAAVARAALVAAGFPAP